MVTLSDYKFLEEAARLNDVAQRSGVPAPARQLPYGLKILVDQVWVIQRTCCVCLLFGGVIAVACLLAALARELTDTHLPVCAFISLQLAGQNSFTFLTHA